MTANGTSWLVVGVVLVAALCHAGWNAIAKWAPDSQQAMALINGSGTVVAGVLVFFVPLPATAAWPYLVASAALHLVYSAVLGLAYRLGDFSQVYPLARGLSPLLVAGAAPLVAAEHLDGVQLVALGLICGGLGGVVFAGGRPSKAGVPGVVAAVMTGVLIASYTVVDGLGVRASGTAAGYTAWLVLLFGPVLPLLLWRRAMRVRPSIRVVVPCLLAGVVALAGYGLVLWAQTRASLALVAALRETSVVFAAMIGAVAFGESFGRARTASAVVIAGGIALLNLA